MVVTVMHIIHVMGYRLFLGIWFFVSRRGNIMRSMKYWKQQLVVKVFSANSQECILQIDLENKSWSHRHQLISKNTLKYVKGDTGILNKLQKINCGYFCITHITICKQNIRRKKNTGISLVFVCVAIKINIKK